MKNNHKMLKMMSIIMGLIAVIAVIAMTPATISYLTSADEVTNPFDLGKVDIEIDETFEVPDVWSGEPYAKLVKIQNLGTEQSLIRVSIVPRWVEADGTTPFAGDTSLIVLDWENLGQTPGWFDGGDGYYYYTAKVETSASTLPILSEVTFNTSGLSENILNRYKDKKLIVDVKAEAVHAYEPAYEAVWNLPISHPADSMLRTLMTTP